MSYVTFVLESKRKCFAVLVKEADAKSFERVFKDFARRDEVLSKKAQDYAKSLTPKKAKQFLVDIGYLTPSGRVAKAFRS